MIMTLRNKSGTVLFIKTENAKRKTGNEINRNHFPLSTFRFPINLAVNRGGNNQGDAEHYRADDDAERGVVVFFDFFVNIKNPAQNSVGNGKENQADKDKNQRRHQNFDERVKFYDQCQNIKIKKINQHLFS